jgi:hypothetical protein
MGCYIDTTNELFCSAFSKAEAARLERKKTAFLFGNFFFALASSKKKWMNGKRFLSSVALFIDTNTPISLFSLRVGPQRKKLCKKEMAYSPARRAPLRVERSLLEKRRKTIARCEQKLPYNSQFSKCEFFPNLIIAQLSEFVKDNLFFY